MYLFIFYVFLSTTILFASSSFIQAQQFHEQARLQRARYFAAAILLQNGKVLITGGQSAISTVEQSCELFDLLREETTYTAPMVTARYLHTALLLNNGKVLVTGGRGVTGETLSSCELYDPATGTWSQTEQMTTPRVLHTLTLLYDGRVLATGGQSTKSLQSAEIFDPLTQAWHSIASFQGTRNSHSAVLLPDSTVMITGGYSTTDGYSGQCFIFNPRLSTWLESQQPQQISGDHTFTLLSNNRILLAGGWPLSQSRCEIYNITTKSWRKTSPMNHDRTIAAAALLPNGNLFVSGGYDSFSSDQDESSIASCEIFDHQTETWSEAPNLPSPSEGHNLIVLPNSNLAVIGGGQKIRAGAFTPTLFFNEIYSLPTNKFSTSNNGKLRTRRGNHTATLLPNGQILIVGGATGSHSQDKRILESCEIIRPLTFQSVQTGSLTVARMSHTSTLLPNGRIIAVGGIVGSAISGYTETASAEFYSYTSELWTSAPPCHSARAHHTATLLHSGNLIVAGGASGSSISSDYTEWEATNSVEQYDYRTNTWFALANMIESRFGHTATLLPNGKTLVTGGRNSQTGTLSTVEIYDPQSNSWERGPSMNHERLFHTATLLPNGEVVVTGGIYNSSATEIYNYRTNQWTIARQNPENVIQQSATLLSTGQILFTNGIPVNTPSAGSPVEIYSPTSDTWEIIDRFPISVRHSSSVLQADNSVLIIGGYGIESGNGISSIFSVNSNAQIPSQTRPVINKLELLATKDALRISGEYFQGFYRSEGSSGNFYSSASNYPLVEIRRIGSSHSDELVQYLPFETQASLWSNTSTVVTCRSQSPSPLPAGCYRLSVIVNGVASLPVFFGVVDTGLVVFAPPTVSVDESPQVVLHPPHLPMILVYPNPTVDNLTVEGSLPGDGNGIVFVELCDVLGTVLASQSFLASQHYRCEFSTSTLAAGSYMMRVRYHGYTKSTLFQVTR